MTVTIVTNPSTIIVRKLEGIVGLINISFTIWKYLNSIASLTVRTTIIKNRRNTKHLKKRVRTLFVIYV